MENSPEYELKAYFPNVFVVEIDGAAFQKMPDLYATLSARFQFPEHFGENLDALFDCLCDLEQLEEQEVVLIVKNAKALLGGEEEEQHEALLTVLKDAESPENRNDDKRFRVFLLH